MSFALSLGVADGGARLLIGDQASDQDWVFNLPETTNKGTFLAKFSVDSVRFPFARHVRGAFLPRTRASSACPPAPGATQQHLGSRR